MKTNARTKILVEQIEARIEKNQRRIKAIAKQNYELRKSVEALKKLPKGIPFKKSDAEHETPQTEVSPGGTI